MSVTDEEELDNLSKNMRLGSTSRASGINKSKLLKRSFTGIDQDMID
jgi:hypothetical protein